MNRLATSASPYLRQHADNPVAWWPWCDEAFAEARRRDVPVLVSIGYSTCHWCHVMAHESFEDPATAAVMNELYVCIKVDREEHPEVDEIYMDAVQALTGHGGWPLNAFTDHSGRPFYALTYLPRERWTHLSRELARLWRDDRPRIDQASSEIVAHLAQESAEPQALSDRVWQGLDRAWASSYDHEHPGPAYGAQRAPKFPASQLLPLLMDRGSAEQRTQVEATLEAMQDSGLHDRVGGGFHRYSVTRDWRLPHFEKMLYDNAQLMGVYARAGRIFEREDFLRSAVNTGDYLLRDMRVMDGTQFLGYASAEDADDPGGEGSFYAWSPAELARVLGTTDGAALAAAWDCHPGEAEVGPHGHVDPVVSHIPHPRGTNLRGRESAVQEQRLSWEVFLPRLRAARDARPRPSRDDKVLTDLNALALEGFAALARFAPDDDRPRFLAATQELAEILRARRRADGLVRLPGRPAYITDYGHLVSGYAAAFTALGESWLIDEAQAVADEAQTRLQAEDGGYFTTPLGRTDLIRRSRESSDNAYPAGQNSLAVGLLRLAAITGDETGRQRADGIFASASAMALRAPSAMPTLLSAWQLRQRGPVTAVIAGPPDPALLAACQNWAYGDIAIISVSHVSDKTWETIDGRRDLNRSQVLVCQGTSCLAPAFTPEDVHTRLAIACKANP